MAMTLGPIFIYVVIQKGAKATNGIRFLTRIFPYLLYPK